MKKTFKEVVCIKSHRYEGVPFYVGNIYPIVGNNNGCQLVYKNFDGNSVFRLLFVETNGLLFDPITSEELFMEI